MLVCSYGYKFTVTACLPACENKYSSTCYLLMSYSDTKALYLWAEMNISSQSLNWTIFDKNVVRQCICHILEDRSGEVKFMCTLVYLPMSYSETKAIYLWAEMNIYSQSLNWMIFGQNVVRQCKCHILEDQTGEVKFRCTLVYLPMSYSETKAIYLWAEMNIYSQSLNWTIFDKKCWQTMYMSYPRRSVGGSLV